MNEKKATLKSVMVVVLSLILVVSVLTPMAAFADTTGNYYTVKSGDTLSKIAASYGITVADIVQLNNISSSATIYPGQVLLMPEGSVSSTTSYNNSGYGNVSVDFNSVDLLSALSAIIKYTDYTILFVGDTQEITVNISDVTPLTAIDYILRLVNMSYIKNDDTLIVGTTSVLNASFIDKATLAKFNLKYITTDVLKEQLGVLGVSVNFIEVGDSNRECWVNAYPMELATIRELISLLDNKTNVTLGSANIANCLTYIEMNYMSASDFSSILAQLGLNQGLTIAAFPMRLFVYVTGDALDDIMKVKALIDVPEADPNYYNSDTSNVSGTDTSGGTDTTTSPGGEGYTDGTVVLRKLTLSYLDKSDAEEILSDFMSDVSVFGIDLLAKSVWLYGSQDDVDAASAIISSFDIETFKGSNKLFTYELENITAQELSDKISAFSLLDDVVIDYGDFPEESYTVMISCPEDQRASVIDIIEKLDTTSTKIYKILATVTSTVEVENLKLEISHICEDLTGIDENSFYFSGDLDSTEGEKYSFYVYESPENIKIIETLFAALSTSVQ